jgi:molybdopterin converting factor subunit 1
MLCVRILFFASVRELVGLSETSITLELDSTTATLLKELHRQYPALKSCEFRLAVNKKYVKRGIDVKLNDLDEVALIPPISGG